MLIQTLHPGGELIKPAFSTPLIMEKDLDFLNFYIRKVAKGIKRDTKSSGM